MKKFYYKNTWEYIPAKQQQSNNITHNKIVGDVFRKTSEKPISVLLAKDKNGNECSTPVYPYKEKLGYSEKIVGYIPNNSGENEEYFRIVEKSLARIMLPILAILVLIAVAFTWYTLKDKGPNIDKTAIAYQMPNGVKNDDPSRIMMPYVDKIVVNSSGESDFALTNPDGNDCYFTYVLVLNDGNKELYRSDLIKPGMAVTKWKLNEKLEPGEYEATLQIKTSELSDYTKAANGANNVVKLIVEE